MPRTISCQEFEAIVADPGTSVFGVSAYDYPPYPRITRWLTDNGLVATGTVYLHPDGSVNSDKKCHHELENGDG